MVLCVVASIFDSTSAVSADTAYKSLADAGLDVGISSEERVLLMVLLYILFVLRGACLHLAFIFSYDDTDWLVNLERCGGNHEAVGRHFVASCEMNDVADDEVPHGDALHLGALATSHG